jgi:hypothetical protein
VCLILVVAAFVGGWVVGRTASPNRTSAFGMPIAPAPPDWTHWQYPNSSNAGQIATGNTTLANVHVGEVAAAHLTTSDPFEQVLGHYAQLLGQPGITGPGVGQSMPGIRAVPGGQEVYGCSYLSLNSPGLKRKVINYRTSNYAVVIDVSRADADKQTHVVISYAPGP